MNAAFSGIRASFLPEFPRAAGNFAGVKEAPDCRILWSESMHDGLISDRRVRIVKLLPCLGSTPRHAAAAAVNVVGSGDRNRSPPAELLVEVDHLGALLKADDDVEIGALFAAGPRSATTTTSRINRIASPLYMHLASASLNRP